MAILKRIILCFFNVEPHMYRGLSRTIHCDKCEEWTWEQSPNLDFKMNSVCVVMIQFCAVEKQTEKKEM